MKNLLLVCLLFLLSVSALYAQSWYAIMPKPTRLTEQKGSFTIPRDVAIIIQSTNPQLLPIARLLADQLAMSTGYKPTVTAGKSGKGTLFVSAKGPQFGAEGYKLTVSPRQITIMAEQAKGFFYGVQTLMQLIPAAVFSPTKVDGVTWDVPACTIDDQPRYGYRGGMLDVGRHYMPVAFIKKYIDLLVLHKMNTFHWHLTAPAARRRSGLAYRDQKIPIADKNWLHPEAVDGGALQ